MVQLSATRCSCIAILWVSLVSFAAITLCVASQRVFIVVAVYFVIDTVRKLLDTPSYNSWCMTLCDISNCAGASKLRKWVRTFHFREVTTKSPAAFTVLGTQWMHSGCVGVSWFLLPSTETRPLTHRTFEWPPTCGLNRAHISCHCDNVTWPRTYEPTHCLQTLPTFKVKMCESHNQNSAAAKIFWYTWISEKSGQLSGIAVDCGLDDRVIGVRVTARAGNFYLHDRAQTSSGAHTASYPMGRRCSFPRDKVSGAWIWPLTSI
jgi:hypothetical protein